MMCGEHGKINELFNQANGAAAGMCREKRAGKGSSSPCPVLPRSFRHTEPHSLQAGLQPLPCPCPDFCLHGANPQGAAPRPRSPLDCRLWLPWGPLQISARLLQRRIGCIGHRKQH